MAAAAVMPTRSPGDTVPSDTAPNDTVLGDTVPAGVSRVRSEKLMEPEARRAWSVFERRMQAEGLNVWLIRSREEVEPAFNSRRGAHHADLGAPSTFHPSYRAAVLLGSAGASFWRMCREARREPAPDPLDRHTEHTVEQALKALRPADPTVLAAYPFAHQRRIVPFLALLEGTTLLRYAPFGVSLHARFGPWFAWRAVLLTEHALPPTALPAQSPCASCPTPCVSACPAGAVAKAGFDWQLCVNHRVAEASCRATCLARVACPVGQEHRYTDEQMAYHYGISLRTILAEGWAEGEARHP